MTAIVFSGAALAQSPAEREPGFLYLKNNVRVKVLQEGEGPSPTDADTVKVLYRGFLPNNSEFETTMKGSGPATLQIKSAIKCWQQGLQTMRAGGKARFFCPPDTAYGKAGKLSGKDVLVPPDVPLEFEVELLEVVRGK